MKFTYPNRIIIPNVHCLGLPGKLRMMNLMINVTIIISDQREI